MILRTPAAINALDALADATIRLRDYEDTDERFPAGDARDQFDAFDAQLGVARIDFERAIRAELGVVAG